MGRISKAGMLGAATLLAVAAAASGPVSAHVPGHDFRTSPHDTTVSGTVPVTATISFGSNHQVQSWFVDILDPSGGSHRLCGDNAANTGTATVNCAWDTTHVVALSPATIAPNGGYQIRVTGHDAGGLFSDGADHADQRAVTVANIAAAPRGVRVTYTESSETITVRWTANSEPDITRYVVQQQVNDGAWVEVGQSQAKATSTTFTRQRPSGVYGTFRYQVAAIRNGAGMSDFSTPAEVTVVDPNPPTTTTTTTTAPPGTGGSGGTGGTGGTGTKTGGGTSAGTGGNATSGGISNSGFKIVPIQGGAPGSVTFSGRQTGGKVVQLQGEPEPDPGFSETLPYKKPEAKNDSNGIAGTIANIPGRVFTDDSARRALLVPLAAGLLLFVFAMQIRFVTRRAV